MILYIYEFQKQKLMKITVSGTTIFITALLCILKVIGILNISWLWCFCLIWLPFAIIFALFFILVILALIYTIIIFIPYLHKELNK